MDEIIGILGIARDVTEQHRASIEREQLRRQLEQSQKLEALGQLVSGVAHELNNPLAAVMAYAQLLLNKPALYTEERQAVDTILHETKRAAKIVSNLLTFARQHQPERSAADLNQVVTDTISLRHYSLTVQGIELILDLDNALPPTWADSFQMQQVLLNLVANAEHALQAWDGPRRLTVATRFENERLLLRVTDSGCGIEEKTLEQIFNPFFTTKGVGMGTGLGLSVSDGIVREHGGRIRVESAPGQGASFIVELPYTDPTSSMFDALEPPAAPRPPVSR
jgi:two-component system NtrC family sensor kinase